MVKVVRKSVKKGTKVPGSGKIIMMGKSMGWGIVELYPLSLEAIKHVFPKV